MGRGIHAPPHRRFRTAISPFTLEGTRRDTTVPTTAAVGVGSQGEEPDEKGQRTETIERSTGYGVLRRTAGDGPARAAHPGPDDRPRPSAASGVPVRSCAQAACGGRGRGLTGRPARIPASAARFHSPKPSIGGLDLPAPRFSRPVRGGCARRRDDADADAGEFVSLPKDLVLQQDTRPGFRPPPALLLTRRCRQRLGGGDHVHPVLVLCGSGRVDTQLDLTPSTKPGFL